MNSGFPSVSTIIPEGFYNSSTARAMSSSFDGGSSTDVFSCWCGWMDSELPSVSISSEGFSNPSGTVETVDGGSCEAADEKPVVAVAVVASEVGHRQGWKRCRNIDQYPQKGMISNSGRIGLFVVAMCLPAGVKAQPGDGGGGGWDYFKHVLMVLGFVGYTLLAMSLGAMLLRIFERIRRQAAQLRGLIGALNGVLPPTPDPDQEHGASDDNGDEKGYEKGGGKGNGKGEGKGEGKVPGKHPSGRPWTDEEVDEYHNDLFVAGQLFGLGSRRRRRPSP